MLGWEANQKKRKSEEAVDGVVREFKKKKKIDKAGVFKKTLEI